MKRFRFLDRLGLWVAATAAAFAVAGCDDTLERPNPGTASVDAAALIDGADAAPGGDADATAALDDGETAAAGPDAGADADAGADVSADVPSDAAVDAAHDTTGDAAADAPQDSAADAQADAKLDTLVDMAADAAPDAWVDGAADAAPDAWVDVTGDALADAAADAVPDAVADVAKDLAAAADASQWSELPDVVSQDSAVDAQNPVDVAADSGDGDASPPKPKPELYEADYIPEFELVVDAEAMAVLMDPSDATKKTWVHAAFTCEGETLADVGLRRKGESTYRVVPQKAAFKIKFNKWVGGQKFRGYKELTLNNMVDDATGLNERLAYALYAKLAVPAPKCNTATVTLNGESYGPYANVETPDTQFLKAYFGTNANTLYEVDWGSEWLPGSEDGMTVDVGSATKVDLIALFAAVEAANDASLLADVKGHLDVDEWLKFCAIEAIIGARDNYAYGIWGSHNHFLAGGMDGLIRLIPWSQDLSFSDDNGIVDTSKPLPADPIVGGETLLVRCKQSAACWNAFKSQVAAVLAAYQTMDINGLANKWHAQIDPLQSTDTKRESSLAFYQASVLALQAWIPARPQIVKTQLGMP